MEALSKMRACIGNLHSVAFARLMKFIEVGIKRAETVHRCHALSLTI